MYLDLFNTPKKNLYEVISDDNEYHIIETNTDIDNTSTIFEKENRIENLKKINHMTTENLLNLSSDLHFITIYNRLLILAIILTPLSCLGFSKLNIINFFLGIGTIGLALGKLIMPMTIGSKRKLKEKMTVYEEKIYHNQEQIDIITKEITNLKQQFAYHELTKIPPINDLPQERRVETMQIRKLIK